MIEAATPVRPSGRAVYRKLAEGSGAVLLHLASAHYHGLNEMGSLIWGLLEQGTTFGALVDGVRQRVEDPPPDLDEDVAAFVKDLCERELVIVGVESSP